MNGKNAIGDLLKQRCVFANIEASGRKQLIQTLSDLAATAFDLEAHAVFDVLWEREKLGTTGIGHGIAIPHAKMTVLENVKGIFVKLAEPVAFDAVDDKPVDLVFLLLSPESAAADHLQALAAVSRLLRDAALCKVLRSAKDPEALYKRLTQANADAETA